MSGYYGKVTLYHTITYGFVLMFLVPVITIASILAPWTGMLGVILIVLFVAYRHGENLRLCKERWLAEAEGRVIEKQKDKIERLRKFVQNFGNTTRHKHIESEMMGMNWCRTCGYCYTATEDNPICTASGIPQHHVKDEPPTPNPYAWWWFQVNGYEPPPFEPKTMCNPFCHEVWGDDNPVQANVEAGKAYYMEHSNHAWDLGYGDPPAWYLLK